MSIFDWNWRKYCCLLIPTATGLAEKRPPSESGGFLTRMLAGTCTGVRNPPSPQTPRKNPASYPFDAGFFYCHVRITSPPRILTNSATFRSSPLSVQVSMHLCVCRNLLCSLMLQVRPTPTWVGCSICTAIGLQSRSEQSVPISALIQLSNRQTSQQKRAICARFLSQPNMVL